MNVLVRGWLFGAQQGELLRLGVQVTQQWFLSFAVTHTAFASMQKEGHFYKGLSAALAWMLGITWQIHPLQRT